MYTQLQPTQLQSNKAHNYNQIKHTITRFGVDKRRREEEGEGAWTQVAQEQLLALHAPHRRLPRMCLPRSTARHDGNQTTLRSMISCQIKQIQSIWQPVGPIHYIPIS
jgi:hypothetical protein